MSEVSSNQLKALKAAMDALEGSKQLEKEISSEVVESTETNQIILPKGMDKLTASKELKLQYESEEQKVDFAASFEDWNYEDVLVAIKKVTEEQFGWMNASWGPTEIDVVVDIVNGKNVTEKAFYGQFTISYWEKAIANIMIDRSGTVHIQINAKRKFSPKVTVYFEKIRQHLLNCSIYRGRNLVVTAARTGGLKFTIIENKGSDMIVLNRDEELVIQDFVVGDLSEKGKRTYLFTGPYGTGKTETAMKVGREAVQKHGMSFMYVKDSNLFEQVLKVSKNYQPCVIFMEDVDEIASSEERDSRMNSILNTLDGVETKGNNLVTIFTTNHADKINPALRRPGRIDLIVQFNFPDAEAKIKIMKLYFKDLLGSDALNYEALEKELPTAQGAVIAEICKRAVKLCQKKGGPITDNTVLSAKASMNYQLQLMNEGQKTVNKHQRFVEDLEKITNGSF